MKRFNVGSALFFQPIWRYYAQSSCLLTLSSYPKTMITGKLVAYARISVCTLLLYSCAYITAWSHCPTQMYIMDLPLNRRQSSSQQWQLVTTMKDVGVLWVVVLLFAVISVQISAAASRKRDKRLKDSMHEVQIEKCGGESTFCFVSDRSLKQYCFSHQ